MTKTQTLISTHDVWRYFQSCQKLKHVKSSPKWCPSFYGFPKTYILVQFISISMVMVNIWSTRYFSVTNGTDVMTSDTEGFSCRNSFADCSLKKYLSIDQPMRERHSGSSANKRNSHANISESSCNLLRNWYTPDSKSVRQNPPQCSCWCQLQSQWVSLKRMGQGENGLDVTQPMATSQLEPDLYPHNIKKQ